MTTTITYSGGPDITPTLALIQTSSIRSEPRTVVHPILDGAPIHTLRSASPRRGVLTLGFLSNADARDCFGAHEVAAIFRIESDDDPLVNFRYVVTGGDIEIAPDEETVAGWVVRVPFEAVIG
ncbi:hypothetical protein ACIGEP_15515 [Microbacterium sp. NPDC077663]|uniref:hypothetical protein n=1 Tax=Microbacterium sp. NPDC077663 TaxID=3364189 RepID=UPI0037C952DC